MMNAIKLSNHFQSNATLVSNYFIDNYMATANGEFVKVYLFLLRHMEDSSMNLTISGIADCLNNTENDILRAFRYWESNELLKLEYDCEHTISGIELLQTGQSPANNISKESIPAIATTSKEASITSVYSEETHTETKVPKQESSTAPSDTVPNKNKYASDSSMEKKELRSLLFIAEQYLGKTLSHTDVEAITYFYKDLGMSARLIEYLIESCVESGHKSIHYIQKVALSWADEGIASVEQARRNSANYNKNCYTVLNAFGIKNRGPADSELVYIKKWTDEMGFSLDIVQEACRRTISATHQPSFEYADSILTKWYECNIHHLTDINALERWQQNNVHHLNDITALDTVFQKEKQARRNVSKSKPVTKNLNNFERRAYDMDSLEEQLLNSN